MASKRDRDRRKVSYSDAKERAEKHNSGDSTSVRVPDGMPFFSVKTAKSIKIDIIPYEVKKGSDEKGGNPHCAAGLVHYERTYFAHRGIGVEQTSVCCLRKTFGKKCPICEDQQKMRRDPDADEKAVADLNPKERQLFVVIDRDDRENEGVMKLWDISYHLFGKMLDAKMKRAEQDDDYVCFYSLEAGKTLRVGFAEEKMGSHAFFKCDDIEMKSRKPLPESLLDEVPDLDSLLVEMSYDELKRYYFQEEDGVDADDDRDDDDDDSDEDDTPPAKKGRGTAVAVKPPTKKPPAKKDDDEDEDDQGDEDDDSDDDEDEDEDFEVGDEVEHDEFGRCTVLKLIDGGKKLDLKTEDGKTKKGVFASDVTPAEEESPPPAKKGGKPAAKPPVDEDDDEDDWDDDDEEDEKPKAKPKKK